MSKISKDDEMKIINEIKRENKLTKDRKWKKSEIEENKLRKSSPQNAKGNTCTANNNINMVSGKEKMEKVQKAQKAINMKHRKMSYSQMKYSSVSFNNVNIFEQEDCENDDSNDNSDQNDGNVIEYNSEEDDHLLLSHDLNDHCLMKARSIPLPPSSVSLSSRSKITMMTPIKQNHSPVRTRTLGPWTKEAIEILTTTPDMGIRNETKNRLNQMEHKGPIHDDLWNILSKDLSKDLIFSLPSPSPAQPIPPIPRDDSNNTIDTKVEENDIKMNEDEWLLQRMTKKTPPSFSSRIKQNSKTTTNTFTSTTRRNTFFSVMSPNSTSVLENGNSNAATERRNGRRRSLYITQLMKDADKARKSNTILHLKGVEGKSLGESMACNNGGRLNRMHFNMKKCVQRGEDEVAGNMPKIGTIAKTVMSAVEKLKMKRLNMKTNTDDNDDVHGNVPFVGSTRRATIFRTTGEELPDRLQHKKKKKYRHLKDNFIIEQLAPSLYLKIHSNGNVDVLKKPNSNNSIKLDYVGNGETMWAIENLGTRR